MVINYMALKEIEVLLQKVSGDKYLLELTVRKPGSWLVVSFATDRVAHRGGYNITPDPGHPCKIKALHSRLEKLTSMAGI